LINIVKEDNTMVENISLKEAYARYVEPGLILYLVQDIPKKTAQDIDKLQSEKWQLKARTYALLRAESIPHNIKPANSGKGAGALRVTPLALSSSEHFKYSLDRSYQFLKHGSPVEFTFRLTGKHIKDKMARLMPSDDVSQLEWMQTHFPHLRPDFILKSMPAGSQYLVDPVSNGRRVQFVIGPPRRKGFPMIPGKNLTRRLFNVKEAVERSIEQGLQGELPKIMREKLANSGSKAYSPLTGKPLSLERAERAVNQEQEAQVEMDFDLLASKDRYMPDKSAERVVKHYDKLDRAGQLDKPRFAKEYVRIKQKEKQDRRAMQMVGGKGKDASTKRGSVRKQMG
jgi:hypothetical protein